MQRHSEHTRRALDWGEWRRQRAWDLKQQGWAQRAMAAAPGVPGMRALPLITRRHLLQAAGALLSAAAAACGASVGGGGAPAGPALSAEAIELTWMPWGSDNQALKAVHDEIAAGFSAKHPNLRVTVTPPAGDFLEKLTTLVAAGTPPDVTDVHHTQAVGLAAAGVIQELTRPLKAAPYPTDHLGWGPFEWRGKRYGVPDILQTSVIYYNRTLFDAAGLPYPEAQWTWQHFAEVALRLTRRQGDVSQYVFGASDYGAANIQWMNALLLSFGGGLYKPDFSAPLITTAASLDALQFRASWALRDHFEPAAEEKQGQGNLFLNGRQAMQISGSWYSATTIKPSAQAQSLQWDVAPVPKGPARRAGLGANLGKGLPAGIEHPNESWAFLRHGTADDALLQFGRLGRSVPARTGLWKDSLPPDGIPSRYKEAVFDFHQETATWPPFMPKWPDVVKAWQDEMNPIWAGQRSVREGAQAFDGVVRPLLQELRA